MNSNRMKYASTPTYGMQKRNFSKKQVAAQTAPTPDFTQQPTLDPNTPLAPFPAQNPFMAPSGTYPGAVAQPNNPSFYGSSGTLPPANQPNFGAVPASNPYNNYIPQMPLNNAPMYQQPFNGSAQPMGNASFSTRSQGFSPSGFPQGGALPPNVIRGDVMNGMNNMPGMGAPGMQGMGMGNPNGMPNGNLAGMGSSFGNVGFPQGPQGNNMGGGQQVYPNQGYQPVMMNPLMNMNGFNRQPFPGMEGGSPAMPTPKPPFDLDRWLKVLLYGILPVLFVPCLFDTHSLDAIRYLFIILSVVSLSVIWYRQSFTSTIRTALSVVYLALSIIVIAMLVSGNNKDLTQTSGSLSARNGAQQTAEPTASVEAAPLVAQETPSPVEDAGKSEAEQRLSTFMDYWAVNRVEDMVNLVQPSWSSTQESPAQALFNVISNRTPLDYAIESISGTASDSSRTVTMNANIDKNNGKDPVRYRFMILMVKESGEWYVDPNSLATNDAVASTSPTISGKETIASSLAPRMTVTPIPEPNTKLYYNANGGQYYHIDPNCSAVNPKYLPLASFLYSELGNTPYKSLSPCLKCGAPTKALSATEAAATATVAP